MITRTFKRAVEAVFGFKAWTDWTPTVTQSSALTLDGANTIARYRLHGRECTLEFLITLNSNGTAGNDIILGNLPVPCVDTGDIGLGSVVINDAGVATYHCAAVPATTTTLKFRGYNVTGFMGSNPSFQAGTSDTIGGRISYRIA